MGKIYLKQTKQKVRKLRKDGLSIGEISLKMTIPKNTISGWVRDISLTKKQIRRIKEKELACRAIGRMIAARLLREKMERWKEGIRDKVKHLERFLYQDADIGKLICGISYLCEGAKYPSSRCLIFSNSDPDIIKYFLALLREHFNVEENKLRCRIMLRWDQDKEMLNKCWSKITKISLDQFFRTTPDKRTKGKPTIKKDYKGVCAIQYPSTSLQFELQAIGETIIKSGAGGT